MGLFGSILNLAVDVVTTPLDIIEDVVNIGDGRESKVKNKVSKVVEDMEDIVDDII